MEKLTSVKVYTRTAQGRTGWEEQQGVPQHGQRHVLHDDVQNTSGIFSVFASNKRAQNKNPEFAGPRKACSVVRKEALRHYRFSWGKRHHKSCHAPHNFCIFSGLTLGFIEICAGRSAKAHPQLPANHSAGQLGQEHCCTLPRTAEPCEKPS